jgi:hypothetical protein
LRSVRWDPVVDELSLHCRLQRDFSSASAAHRLDVSAHLSPVQFHLSFALVHSMVAAWALIQVCASAVNHLYQSQVTASIIHFCIQN